VGRASSIVIGLFPGRIEVATRTSKGLSGFQSREVDCSWEDAWKLGLSPFDAPLRELLTRCKAIGSTVTVVYDSPDAVAEVNTYPMVASEALAAAHLAFSADPAHARVASFSVIWETVGQSPKTEILAASDRIGSAEVIVAWIKRAGGRVRGLIPAIAADLAKSIRILQDQPSEGKACVLYVGEHRSAIVGRDGSNLVFARSVDSGARLFAEAISAAPRTEGQPMPVAEALEWVKRNGAPTRDISPPEGIRAISLAPLLTPVIQRFAVEAKQTLRFGFGIDASAATLIVHGTWGPFQGLAKVLGSQLDMDAVELTDTPPVRGGLTNWAELAHASFLPPSETLAQQQSRLNRMFAGGLATAMLLIVAEAGWIRSARAAVDENLKAQETAIAAMNQTIDATNQAAKLAQEVDILTKGVAICDLGKVDYLALLGELSRITPPSMRLAEIATGSVRDGTELTLRGTVTVADDQPDALTPFLDALRSSPVVSQVELGSTRLSEESGRRVKDFTLTARLIVTQGSAAGGTR
jgi:Tfp pilus assembly protein PilN